MGVGPAGESEEDAALRAEAYRVALARVFGEVRDALVEERLRAVQAEIEQARAGTHPLLVAQQQEMTDREGERVWAAEQHHALQLAEMAALCEQECAFARRDADAARAAAQQRLVADLVAREQHDAHYRTHVTALYAYVARFVVHADPRVRALVQKHVERVGQLFVLPSSKQ